MLKLIIEDDEGKKTVVPLIRDEITIGRKEGNTIRLTERNVSRQHAKLLKHNGALFVEDLESYNGIRVNGNRISGRVAVTEGDRIQIGDYAIGVQADGVLGDRAAGASAAGTNALGASPSDSRPAGQPMPPPLRSPKPTGERGAIPPAIPGVPPPAPNADAMSVARVVCVSNNFAGMEVVLDKPTTVIGRTPDNDVVFNHRSISRHHAQIIEEDGRYLIMDMQSVNGVRVNGEEYGKVELRRGDLIDLGHVRLRFVAPGEPFNFATDATIFDTSRVSPSRNRIWIGLAAVAVLAVGLLLWRLTHTSSDAPTDTMASAGQQLSERQKLANQAQRDLLRQIRNAVDTRDWDHAIADCALLHGEFLNEAAEDCLKARVERTEKIKFDRAVEHEMHNEHRASFLTFETIDAESVYNDAKLQSDYYRLAKQSFEKMLVQAVDELVASGDCEGAQTKAEELITYLPDAKEAALAKVKECSANSGKAAARGEPRAERRRPTRTTSTRAGRRQSQRKPTTPQPESREPAGPTPEQVAAAQKTLDQAWKAYRDGYYALAASLARKVLRTMPNQQALSIVGASACYLKRAKEAQSAYNRLDSKRRQLLRRVCERMGVPVN